MSTSLLPFHARTRDIKFLNWWRWNEAERKLKIYTNRKKQAHPLKRHKWEGERYHLYCMHTVFFPGIVATLRMRLSKMYGPQVTLDADCIWVDGTPKAHWTVKTVMDTSVELADLLVEVSVTAGGTTNRRAVLIQAKYTDQCDDLGSGACYSQRTDSTNLERNLLEVHGGGIRLYANGGRSTPIPARYENKFNVSKDIAGHKLITHSRYLLIPQHENLAHTPYLSLNPYDRASGQGEHEDYEELLCRLAAPPIPSGNFASVIPILQHGQQWKKLVDAIGRWADMKATAGVTLGRFEKDTPYRISQFLVQSQTSMDKYYQYIFWKGLAPVLGERPPHDRTSQSKEDRPPKGFWHVRLRVAYPEPQLSQLHFFR